MVGIDVRDSRELQAAILALRGADRSIQANIRQYTRGSILPDWQKQLAAAATTDVQQKVLVATARVKASNQSVSLTVGTVGRPLKGGLNPKVDAKAIEFGGDRNYRGTYTQRSRKGKAYKVTRRTQAQLGPRIRQGKVVYPTAERMIPRYASLWVQIVIRTMFDALEGKR